MTDYQAMLEDTRTKLLKAIGHLEYSHEKIQHLPSSVEALDEEGLETWEGFSARFSRVSDIFIAKFLRTKIMLSDPGFRGSVRDVLNQAEKLDLIDSAEEWMVIRGIRNVVAHDYNDEEVEQFFQFLKAQCPRVLSIKALLTND